MKLSDKSSIRLLSDVKEKRPPNSRQGVLLSLVFCWPANLLAVLSVSFYGQLMC